MKNEKLILRTFTHLCFKCVKCIKSVVCTRSGLWTSPGYWPGGGTLTFPLTHFRRYLDITLQWPVVRYLDADTCRIYFAIHWQLTEWSPKLSYSPPARGVHWRRSAPFSATWWLKLVRVGVGGYRDSTLLSSTYSHCQSTDKQTLQTCLLHNQMDYKNWKV